MVLVGDSAHAPSNSSGQGASLAIESAVAAGPLPARPARRAVGVRRVRAAAPRRVERIAARAARINHAKAPARWPRVLMPLLMPLMMKAAMNPEKTIGPEQRYVIDWDTPVTVDPALR